VISARKRAASRANGRRSAGPRTPRGKAHARANARLHGLTIPVVAHPHLAAEVEELAARIAGEQSDLIDAARAVAEAQVDLMRVRRLRKDLFATALRDLPAGRKRRGERVTRLVAECHRIIRMLNGEAEPDMAASEPDAELRDESREEREVRAFVQVLKPLMRLDRYEQRCRSRRQRAIRALDERRAAGAARRSIAEVPRPR
jgi:hypothetical protein